MHSRMFDTSEQAYKKQSEPFEDYKRSYKINEKNHLNAIN